jgi:hypothetical protein
LEFALWGFDHPKSICFLAFVIKPGLLALKSELEVTKKNIQEGGQEFTGLGFLAQLDNDWFATKLLPQNKTNLRWFGYLGRQLASAYNPC